MPVFTLNTNVSSAQLPAGLKDQLTDAIAKSLGKPKAYIAVQVNAGQDISFGGSEEPAALCDLVSIGALSTESNKKHAKLIMQTLQEALKVSPQRTYISFKNMNKADIGFSSTTFDELL
mgnify:CR=1 FL=1